MQNMSQTFHAGASSIVMNLRAIASWHKLGDNDLLTNTGSVSPGKVHIQIYYMHGMHLV